MKPDTATHYGTVTRLLHWGMALLFFWQFVTAAAHFVDRKSALGALLWPSHKPVGLALLALACLRALWALVKLRQRPPELNLASALGHAGLYLLMLAVPVLAMLRQWGAGAPGEKVEWAIQIGNLLHGELGWTLAFLAVGHALMVVWHRRSGAHDVLPRMRG